MLDDDDDDDEDDDDGKIGDVDDDDVVAILGVVDGAAGLAQEGVVEDLSTKNLFSVSKGLVA